MNSGGCGSSAFRSAVHGWTGGFSVASSRLIPGYRNMHISAWAPDFSGDSAQFDSTYSIHACPMPPVRGMHDRFSAQYMVLFLNGCFI